MTYRFYDYNRTDEFGKERPLQMEQAINALDVNLHSSIKHYQSDEFIEEKNFSTKLLQNITEYQNSQKSIECLTLLDGSGVSILLEPDEKINRNIESCIISKITENKI